MRSGRYYVYGGLLLFAVWILGAFYLSTSTTLSSSSRNDGDYAAEGTNSIDNMANRAQRLELRMKQMERQIEEQRMENEQLRQLVEHRVDINSDHKVGAPPPPAKVNLVPSFDTEPIALLVIACNRSAALKNHLQQLIKLRPSAAKFPIIVSQDCEHEETANVVKEYGDQMKLIHQPDQRPYDLPKKVKKFTGYYKIARHYRWALNQTVFKMGYKTVIITEDDLDISIDFFEYFIATSKLLREDKSLFCVSAWNDNGKNQLIEHDPALLWRTDFFPGLGWMITSDIWKELEVKWPEAYWDDWLRLPEQRNGRSCIRPEVPRTAMSLYGKVGVSKGLYFEKHLKHIKLNDKFVQFTKVDLSYLKKDAYDKAFALKVYSTPSITQPELRSGKLTNGEPLPPAIRLTYEDKNTYKSTAKAFSLMDDFRAGVPRMAYRGVVAYMFQQTRVYLAPPSAWTEYDPKWN